MADKDQLTLLKQGVESWNNWRKQTVVQPNLRRADLRRAKLREAVLFRADLTRAILAKADLQDALLVEANLNDANLKEAQLMGACLLGAKAQRANLRRAELPLAELFGTDLRRADLQEANFIGAKFDSANLNRAKLRKAYLQEADLARVDLRNADLRSVDLSQSNLYKAKLNGANLRDADLSGANLNEADLRGADMTNAFLIRATLVRTDLRKANLTGCHVYGISSWDTNLKGALQSDLVITPLSEPMIQVDNVEMAQFLYLLLNNRRIRYVIDTITSKVVLILGRFTPQRKIILDAIREELRKRNYLPVLFDFEKPASRDLTETVSTLAHMARFVIADITDAKSIPQELERIAPHLPSVPIQPLLLSSNQEYGMFEHFRRYPWVLEPFLYRDQKTLLAKLDSKVISPAEIKAVAQLAIRRKRK